MKGEMYRAPTEPMLDDCSTGCNEGGLKAWEVLTLLKKLTSSMSFAIFISMSRVGVKWADRR
jgi:hypothetical protein